MRAFVAIDASDEIRAELARVQQELARCPAKVKWVTPQNVHLTLKFLGDVAPEAVEQVAAAMAAASGGGAVPFAVEGLGSFPPRGRPRVLWAGVSAGADAVSRVQVKLEAALRPLGFKQEHRFVPHLTIGRVKSPRGAQELIPMLERHAATKFGSCTAAEMVLYESELTPQGAVYRAVARQPL